ncbi:YrzE family protein [Legionella maceachernii]|uniref:Uncharacterized protein n=1 Tax=Legionella maceachernii TaxID=466 RepID=A0A0W0WBJ3_9GAMM|nr:YrzE family protein [Legionella maceachernii]KTD29689.1 hypothetical protein Lmac_0864 [Legionella maceachernii]SKA21149.1 hypothetical protein SAMN02745128_02608 [Legionella maceachernii]SUP02568.1 Uncharacterised protein [Legionella maceachernii]
MIDSESKNNKSQLALTPAIVERIVSNQTKDLELREKEIEQAKLTQSNDHEFALASLQAQIQDRADERKHEANNTKYYLGFAMLIIAGLFGLFALAISKGKDQIVMEILKVITYVGAGALGGYTWGARSKKTTNSDNE